jgi:uncharacterized protein
VTTTAPRQVTDRRIWAGLAAGAVVWLALYRLNQPVWDRLVFGVGGLDPESRFGHAVHFFFYDTVKILLLIAGMMYAIGMLRASIGPERIRSLLTGSTRSPATCWPPGSGR